MIERRYWFASHPFSETHLLLAPSAHASETVEYQLKFYDPDGFFFNEAHIAVEPISIATLELEPFLHGLKFESGLRHGCVSVSSSDHGNAWVRLASKTQVSILSSLIEVKSEANGFFPINFAAERKHLLVAINSSDEEAHIRGRLFLRNRAPDVPLIIPPHGSRCIPLESAFEDVLSEGGGNSYLRLTVKQPARVSFLIAESQEQAGEGEVVSVWGAAA